VIQKMILYLIQQILEHCLCLKVLEGVDNMIAVHQVLGEDELLSAY
jgi:hypothetical protein